MNITISEQYHLYGQQVIAYIESHFLMPHPIRGLMPVKLQQHQKMLVKQILQKHNIIRQSRQCGMSSLFVWIAQAIKAINPKIKVLIYVQYNKQKQSLNRIAQINSVEINIRNITQYAPAGLTHLQLYDLSGPYTDQTNTLLSHTNLQLDHSKLISISLNHPGVEQYKLWKDSLLKKSKFNVIYVPWYIIRDEDSQWSLKHKYLLGFDHFYNQYLV